MSAENKKPLLKRKPFRILALLPEVELDQFEHFLIGSMPGKTSDSLLVNFFRHCRELRVWEEEISRASFLDQSGLSMSNSFFDKLISMLYQQLLNFAGVMGLQQNPSQILPFALDYFSQRSMPSDEVEKKASEGHRILRKTIPNAGYFKVSLDLHLTVARASQSRTEKPVSRGLHMLHDDLDAYYFIQKLRFLCASLNEKEVFQNTWKQQNETELMQWLDKAYIRMPDLARTYYHVYYILKGAGDENHFGAFRQLLEQWESDYGNDTEITDLYAHLLNYYSIKYNDGDLNSLPQIDQIFEDLLSRGTILEGGQIMPEHFKNVISVKCRLGKPKEARRTFMQYSECLTDGQDGAALIYNDICIAFYEGRFDYVRKAIEPLLEAPNATKTDMYYGLDLRCLLLKNYYRLLTIHDFTFWDTIEERLRGLLRSFRGYIIRKDISQMSKVRFENFRKALSRLYLLEFTQTSREEQAKGREKLLIEFRSSSNLPDKVWFIAQVEP